MDTTPYVEWLYAQGLEDSTVTVYRGKLLVASSLVCGQGWDMNRLTPSQLRWLAEQFPNTRSSRGTLRAALKHYWEMNGTTGPVKAIRLPKNGGVDEYHGLEDDEAAALESCALHLTPQGLAVLVGLYLALRRSELVRMEWEEFDDQLEWVHVLGKGRKWRLLPIHPFLRVELLRNMNDTRWVFPGHHSHIHPGTVYRWVQETADAAGIGKVNPHALRHTCLTRMYEETGDVRVVQAFAGHADPATTARYTRVPQRMLAAAVGTLHYQAA